MNVSSQTQHDLQRIYLRCY